MRFQTKLISGTLIKRYKRFFVDVRLQDGREVTAHCPNTGAMTGLIAEGTPVWVEPNDDPKKKLKFGLRTVVQNDALVVVDTGIANRVVGEALRAGAIEGLEGDIQSEVKYGENSRADFLVTQGERKIWVEVKSVTLSREAGLAEFPDTKTARGAKHFGELQKRVEAGDKAVMLYAVAREDCDRFAVAADLDPDYGRAAQLAHDAGVDVRAIAMEVSESEVTLSQRSLALI